jgi:acetyltransferase-like isoleucine patch superfamily enzyme
MRALADRLLRRLAFRLGVLIQHMDLAIADATLPQFANRPANLHIERPRTLVHPERISLGDDVWLGPGTLLMAITRYPSLSMQPPGGARSVQEFQPRIVIGHRVTSTAGLQIAALNEIIIEDEVMFASNINLTDGLHGYQTADEPYKYQPMFKIAPIHIQRGCWIGQNVVIQPGVTIGQQTIVGANSVVNRSLPARCIAVGSPARVIKRWDAGRQAWVSVDGTEDQDVQAPAMD